MHSSRFVHSSLWFKMWPFEPDQKSEISNTTYIMRGFVYLIIKSLLLASS